MVKASILANFEQILGVKGFTSSQEDIAPWLQDWRGLYRGKAIAILSPASVSEVQQCLAIAAQHNVPLVPQGGNTSMVGGATPSEDASAIILSTRRMNAIRQIDADANQMIAEAGAILEQVHSASYAVSRRFPLSLGAKGSATIGGLVSTNAGGTQVLRFGTMRNLVLGLEAVLPNGELFSSLNALKKDNRGFDLGQLLIGAEGTLGIITAATLKLVPAVQDNVTAWIGLKSPQIALRLLRWMEMRTGDAVESFELVPESALRLVLQHIPGTRPPLSSTHAWHVLLEFVENDAQPLLEKLLAEAAGEGLLDDAVVSSNVAQSNAFWKIRESVSEAERADGPAIQHDISVPVDAMPDFILAASAEVEAKFLNVRASAFGHLGDGNVHFHVRAPQDITAGQAEEWRKAQGKAASDFVYDLVVAAGGSISAEHGIGQMKRAVFGRTGDKARLSALAAIKSAMDPNGIMNPGKLLPLASELSPQ